MRLLHRASLTLSLFLFILIGIWGVFFYFSILDEVYDETDDRLKNSRDILISKVLLYPEVLTLNDTIMQSYRFKEISVEEAKNYEDELYDSTIYIENEDEWEPVRVLKSCFLASNDRYYEVELRISTLERDDLVRAILIYLLILYLFLFVFIWVGNYFILKRTFNPLQKLLVWLEQLNPGKPTPKLLNNTDIKEFRKLNETAVAMSMRSEKAYQEQKEFIENASHELQTPLAISMGKLELLAESENLDEKQIREISKVYDSLNRAVKMNQSLLLLTRINNGQYTDASVIEMNRLIVDIVADLEELFEYKNIRYSIREESVCRITINEQLAHILLTNLIKNAISYVPDEGEVEIDIYANEIVIRNSGSVALDEERLFQRFYKSDQSKVSVGLGLSIVKSIMDFYGYGILYKYQNAHIFTLKFVKSAS